LEDGEVLYMGGPARHTSGLRTFIDGDVAGQFSTPEGITGVDSTNSDNGTLYLRMAKIIGLANFVVQLFKDADLTELVAEDPLARTENNVDFASVNNSGISGTIFFDAFEFDTDQIAIRFPFPWEISYNFAVSENVTNFDVGGILINKKGWQYADVRYAADVQLVGGKNRVTQIAKYVYVHDVRKIMDFDTLLIDDDVIFP